MGKEEILDALVGLQTTTSVDSLCAQFVVIHDALRDSHRKRSKFLEDACSVVLHQMVAKRSDTCEGFDALLTTESVKLYLRFIEPLIHSTVSLVDALNDDEEATSQRGVLVAALLHVFAKTSGDVVSKEVKSRLVANVLRCGVDLHVILATLRFRERIVECRQVLLPSYDSDSETEFGEESDEEEETSELAREDIQWIVDRVANVWGLTKYRHFLQMLGHEYAFSSWSDHGIGNFVHALLTDDQHKSRALPVVVSPFSWLFHVTAYAHYMIRSEDHQDRLRGLDLLQVASSLCPQGKLTISAEKESESMREKPQSFQDQARSFCARNWLAPLLHVVTNAMISFREVTDRSATLEVLKALTSKLVGEDRFRLLRSLIMTCPYGNVSAVLLDFVREDAVQAWSHSETSQQDRAFQVKIGRLCFVGHELTSTTLVLAAAFKTTTICLLIQDVLGQTVERDNLALQADLLASCMSLVRFLYIRDTGNETGIRTKSVYRGIRDVLVRINERHHVEIQETTSCHTAEGGLHSGETDFTHLMVLEAALGSTLELLPSMGVVEANA